VSDFLTTITKTFPENGPNAGSPMAGIGTLGQLGVGGMGIIGNIISAIRANQVSSDLQKQQKLVMELARNPAMLAARARALQQPLSQSLLSNVGSGVQSQLQSRGLGSSPAQAGAIMSQTLAPYEQRQQEEAMNSLLNLLGMGSTAGTAAAGAVPKPADTSGFWKTFMPQASTPATGAPSLTFDTDTDSGWGG